MTFDLATYLSGRRALIEEALERWLAGLPAAVPATLAAAMRHSLMAGGKRLRPVLALAACDIASGRPDAAIEAACAIEMIHTYSLIHDDLPAMDDDDFRRGRPTCHKVYGEAIAILAGDALLSEAFALVCAGPADAATRAALVLEIARASGAAGMVGGQVIDVEATGRAVDVAHLERLHRAKTGELLLVSLRAGAIAGGADADLLARLSTCGRAVGLAFQIVDDVLDVTADLATLGKDPGSDGDAGKTTFVDLLGVEGATARARSLVDEALGALEPLGARALPLAALVRYAVDRDR